MSQVANNRRKAVNKISQVNGVVASATVLSELRKSLPLSKAQRQQLAYFGTEDKRTQLDVYTVFECRAAPNARVSIECDVPPVLIAEKIVGLDQKVPSMFYLPAYGMDWTDLQYPRFHSQLFSSVRYPKYADDKKTVIPYTRSPWPKTTPLDRIQTMMALLHGTCMEYFRTNDSKYFKLTWQVYRTLIQGLYGIDDHHEFKSMDVTELITLIAERDSSLEAAVRYRDKVHNLHPKKYYELFYQVMMQAPEMLHKSRFIDPVSLLWGFLITNPEPKQQDQLSVSFLRLFLERGMVRKSIPTNLQITNEDELVQWCMEQYTTRLQSTLKIACLVQSLVKLMGTELLGPEGLKKRMCITRDSVNQLEGILPYCQILCPTANLTNAILAEIWIAACQCPKNSVLDIGDGKTERLHKILYDTNTKIQTLRQEVKQLKIQQDDDYFTGDPAIYYQELLDEIKSKTRSHLFTSECLIEWCKKMYSMASSGDLYYLPVFEYMEKNGVVILGKRRFLSFLYRCTPEESPLYRHYYGRHWIHYVPKAAKNVLCRFLWQVQGARLESPKKFESKEDVGKSVAFIPFERSVELVARAERMLDGLVDVSECLICFDENPEFVSLHNDVRHRVCVSCMQHLTVCPFCRVEL